MTGICSFYACIFVFFPIITSDKFVLCCVAFERQIVTEGTSKSKADASKLQVELCRPEAGPRPGSVVVSSLIFPGMRRQVDKRPMILTTRLPVLPVGTAFLASFTPGIVGNFSFLQDSFSFSFSSPIFYYYVYPRWPFIRLSYYFRDLYIFYYSHYAIHFHRLPHNYILLVLLKNQ